MITWSKIDLSKSWIIEKISTPRISFRKTEKIIEDRNGDVEIFFNKIEETIMPSEASSSSVKGIFISNQQIPYGIYSDEPSFSEMEFRVNTLNEFLNLEKCSKEFMLPIYKKFRKWHFSTFSPIELESFKEKYYKHLTQRGYEIPFV